MEKITKKEITDATILEKISEANNQKVHIAKSKSGIVVKGIDEYGSAVLQMLQSGSGR